MEKTLQEMVERITKEELVIKKSNAWGHLLDSPQTMDEVIIDICKRISRIVKGKYTIDAIKKRVVDELKTNERANDLSWLRALGGVK